jgi:hypothetical protein
MTENDSNKFKELIAAINETYGEQFSQAQTLLWWNMFKPHSIQVFEQAVYQHMACPDTGMFTPKPANIMKFINGTSKQNEQALDDKSEIAWHVIEGEIRRIGSHTTLRMEDRQALAAVKAIGGWKKICGLTISELTWAHKEFVAAYKNYERTDVNLLPDKLPGRIHLENNKRDQQGGMKNLSDGLKRYQQKHDEAKS